MGKIMTRTRRSCAVMQLLLLFIYCVLLASGVAVEGNNQSAHRLHWQPNHAGLFSQFLQLKLMVEQASQHGLDLVVLPTTSPHYGTAEIRMCEIFVMPRGVVCGALPPQLRCEKNFKKALNSTNPEGMCYSGTISFNSHIRVRSSILRAVDLPFELMFTLTYEKIVDKFYDALQKKACALLPTNCGRQSFTFTVVHWRRGDQLPGRCAKNVDTSVNCANAFALAQRVREISADQIVYVATNEPQHSPNYSELRRHGFLTYADLASGDSVVNTADVFQLLAGEVGLMLRAATFLGWGVSEINDVVEHARRAAGRNSCVGQEVPSESAQHSWCTLHMQPTRRA